MNEAVFKNWNKLLVVYLFRLREKMMDEHGTDVGFDEYLLFIEGECANGARGVGTDRGKRYERRKILWDFAAMFFHNFLRALTEQFCTTVIPEPAPFLENIRKLCFRKRMH